MSLQSTTIHVGGSISEGSSTSAAADDDNVFDNFKVPKTPNRVKLSIPNLFDLFDLVEPVEYTQFTQGE